MGKDVHPEDEIRQSADRTQNTIAADDDLDRHKRRVVSLYKEHNSALIRFLSVRLHSVEEAEEIAQEAYVKVLGLDEPDAVSHFRGYLFRVAANLAADRLRQRHRRAELRKVAFAGAQSTSPSPERVLDAEQELATIREAISELPAKCRTAFLLHKILQVSLTETARRMDLTERMVRLYVARSLDHCAGRLDSATRHANSPNTQLATEKSWPQDEDKPLSGF